MRARSFPTLLPSVLVLGLSACGGGGGSDSSSGAANPPVTISAANSTTVGVAGLSAIVNSLGSADLTASFVDLPVGVQVDTNAQAPRAGAIKLTLSLLEKGLHATNGPDVPVGVTVDETLNCDVGGTIRVHGEIANPNVGMRAGDRISLVASACADNSSGYVDGGIDFRVTSVATDTNGITTMSYTVTYSSLKSTVGNVYWSVNGSSSLSLAHNATLALGTVKAAQIDYGWGVAGKTASFRMSDQELIFVVNGTTGAMVGTAKQSVSFNYPRFSGSVVLTPVADLQFNANGDIYAGKFKLTGAGSVLYVTYTGLDTVRFDLDSNADGVIDSTESGSIGALEAKSVLW